MKDLDPDRTVKASGRELRISPKHAREICMAIKGKMLSEAKEYLLQVIDKKVSVPFRRHHGGVGHRADLSEFHAGRYPVKAAREILGLLRQAEANAEYKGLVPEDLKIIYAVSHRGTRIKRYIPRAFGRATPRFQQLTHIEMVLQEVGA